MVKTSRCSVGIAIHLDLGQNLRSKDAGSSCPVLETIEPNDDPVPKSLLSSKASLPENSKIELS